MFGPKNFELTLRTNEKRACNINIDELTNFTERIIKPNTSNNSIAHYF